MTYQREVDVVGDENGFEVGLIVVDTYDMEVVDYEEEILRDDWYDDNAESRYC